MMFYHTKVTKAKVAVTLESETLERLDRLVSTARFANRSQAIEVAVEEKLQRIEHRRLAEECAKLDRESEQEFADMGLEKDAAAWPRY
jgi:Arc/MetJ-type ribon-helix-helix transcriptional regulator